MEILDQDFNLLKVGHEQACRDNVQFVQMRRFLRMAADGSKSLRWSKVALAKEVLAELPTQLLEYFERKRIAPCHSIPGQPEHLRDLIDPEWWRTYTQPIISDDDFPPRESNSGDIEEASGTSSPRESPEKCISASRTISQHLMKQQLSSTGIDRHHPCSSSPNLQKSAHSSRSASRNPQRMCLQPSRIRRQMSFDPTSRTIIDAASSVCSSNFTNKNELNIPEEGTLTLNNKVDQSMSPR